MMYCKLIQTKKPVDRVACATELLGYSSNYLRQKLENIAYSKKNV